MTFYTTHPCLEEFRPCGRTPRDTWYSSWCSPALVRCCGIIDESMIHGTMLPVTPILAAYRGMCLSLTSTTQIWGDTRFDLATSWAWRTGGRTDRNFKTTWHWQTTSKSGIKRRVCKNRLFFIVFYGHAAPVTTGFTIVTPKHIHSGDSYDNCAGVSVGMLPLATLKCWTRSQAITWARIMSFWSRICEPNFENIITTTGPAGTSDLMQVVELTAYLDGSKEVRLPKDGLWTFFLSSGPRRATLTCA